LRKIEVREAEAKEKQKLKEDLEKFTAEKDKDVADIRKKHKLVLAETDKQLAVVRENEKADVLEVKSNAELVVAKLRRDSASNDVHPVSGGVGHSRRSVPFLASGHHAVHSVQLVVDFALTLSPSLCLFVCLSICFQRVYVNCLLTLTLCCCPAICVYIAAATGSSVDSPFLYSDYSVSSVPTLCAVAVDHLRQSALERNPGSASLLLLSLHKILLITYCFPFAFCFLSVLKSALCPKQ